MNNNPKERRKAFDSLVPTEFRQAVNKEKNYN